MEQAEHIAVAEAQRWHAETDLGTHHSPDLFHGQHEVSKTTALARDVRQTDRVEALALPPEAARQAYWNRLLERHARKYNLVGLLKQRELT